MIRGYLAWFKFLVSVCMMVVIFNTNLFGQPLANFSSNVVNGCTPLIVQFINTSTGANWYHWEFGNGNDSFDQHPGAIFASPGVYTVTLTVSDGIDTSVETKIAYISVYQVPSVKLSADKTFGCAPFDVNFEDESIPGSSTIIDWFWDFGDGGFATEKNPLYRYDTSGIYTVKLFVWDANGCQNFDFTLNYVSTLNPNVSFNAPSMICSVPATIDFVNTSSGSGMTYQWDFDDGAFSSAINPSHTYVTASNYAVKLIGTDADNCTDTAIKIINMTGFNADFEPQITKVYCNSDSFKVRFTDSSSAFTNTWFWDFGDTDTSYSQNPFKTYNSFNSFPVTLIADDGEGCVDSITKMVTYQLPVADYNADSTFSCVPPYTVNYTNLSTGVMPLSYVWTFGDTSSPSNLTDPLHTFWYSGVFKDTLSVTDDFGCADTLDAQVVVRNSPAVIVGDTLSGCIPLKVDFTDSSSVDAIVLWQWNFGDPPSGASNTSNLQSPTHIYSDTGKYTITLIVQNINGCRDTLVAEDFITAGIKPDSIDFLIVPNDTICYQDTINFIDNSSFINPGIKVNTWEWDIYYGVWPNVITLSDTDKVTWQFNEQYAGPGIFTGEDTVRLIAGFYGCNDTITKPIFIYIPVAIDGSLKTPLGCKAPFTIGLFNSSFGYTTFVGWTVTNFSTGALVDSGSTDTTTQTFTKSGIYYYNIEVRNDTAGIDGSGCTSSEGRFIIVDSSVASFFATPLTSCKNGNSFSFADSSYTKYGTVKTYFWDFGDGDTLTNGVLPGDSIVPKMYSNGGRTTGTFKNPIHSYKDTGTYNVKLSLQVVIRNVDAGSKACNLIDSQVVRVIGPYVDFGNDTSAGCPGLLVNFTDSSNSTSSMVSWQWDFGDGTPLSPLKNPNHTYNQPGAYAVQLIATDFDGCSDTLLVDSLITITKPVAAFSTIDTQVCLGDVVSFSNGSLSSGLAYFWDFGDGNTDSIYNASHIYNDTGLYTISLTVTDINSCDSTLVLSDYIDVMSVPSAGFVADTTYVECFPLIVNFTDTSSVDVVSWRWDFGDNYFSNLQNPSHIYIAPSLYDVTLVVTNSNGCTDTSFAQDLINIGGPYGSFTIDPDSTCIPHMVTFVVTATNSDFYIWDFGDGSISTINPVSNGDTTTHIYTKTGTRLPKLILKDSSGCSYVIPSVSMVYGDDVIVDFMVNDSFFCDFDTLILSNLTKTLFSIVSWDWDFGDGSTSSLKNPIHPFDSMGVYSISLKAESIMGCIDSNSMDITVRDQPKIIVTASDTLGCIPFTVSFHADTIGNVLPVTLWAWDFGDSLIKTGNDVQHTFTSKSIDTVRLSATYSQGKCIADTLIRVRSLNWPIADFDYSPPFPSVNNANIIFTDKSNEATIWNWNFDDGSTSNERNPVHQYTKAGKYYIVLVTLNEDSCADEIAKMIFIASSSGIKVPNAFTPNGDGLNDEFRIMNAGILELMEFKIYNRWGELVFETNDITKGWDGTFKGKLQNVGSYVYYVVARTADSSEPVLQKGSFSLLR